MVGMAAAQMSEGCEFHAAGPACEKAPSLQTWFADVEHITSPTGAAAHRGLLFRFTSHSHNFQLVRLTTILASTRQLLHTSKKVH